CSSDTIVIIPKQTQYKALALCCVSSDQFVAFASKTSQGTQMPRANWDILATFSIVMPPQNLLTFFDNFVESAINDIINLIFRNRTLRRTRDRLLPRLVSGDIDVSSWVGGDGETERELAEVAVRADRQARRVAETARPIEPLEQADIAWNSLWGEGDSSP